MSYLSEGELTSATFSLFPARRDPEEQEKKAVRTLKTLPRARPRRAGVLRLSSALAPGERLINLPVSVRVKKTNSTGGDSKGGIRQ